MVEDMYQQELKEAEQGSSAAAAADQLDNREKNQQSSSSNDSDQHLAAAQTPTTASTPPPPLPTTGKRSDINATESDPSLAAAINRQGFSENQATTTMATASEVAPPVSDSDQPPPPHNNRSSILATDDDTCRHGRFVTAEYGTANSAAAATASDIGSTLIRFGTTSGDVSLTLGLRHAGNMPEKTTPFSLRDFGGI